MIAKAVEILLKDGGSISTVSKVSPLANEYLYHIHHLHGAKIKAKIRARQVEIVRLEVKAWMLANMDKNSEALPIIEKALDIDPGYARGLDTKGFILYNLQRYEEAITFYDRVLSMDPNNVQARKRKALATEKLREKE
jgi:tetratricopeptide (TPR) repeat protein